MRLAYDLHASGRLDDAEAAYRRILDADGENADTLFLLGEIANRKGNAGEAAALLARAIALDAGVASFHCELGAALAAQGNLAEAEQSYRRALELDADNRMALVDLSALLLDRGMPEAAEQRARQALRLHPGTLAAHVNLGSALEALGRLDEAAASLEAALQIDADCVPAHTNLGSIRLKQERIADAERHLARALAIDPGFFEARINLGSVLLQRKRPADAVAAFREAVRQRPDSAAGQFNLGYALETQGDLAEAMRCYETAVALDPESVQAHVNRATLLLMLENFRDGWPEFEWRLRKRDAIPVHARFTAPRWDGAPLAGRALLVYGEQGLGDEIMYASCLPQVIAQAGRCIVDCDPRLAPIFRRSFPQAIVHGGTQQAPPDWLHALGPVDVQIPAGSLPLHLRRSADAFPAHRGYLKAAPERIEHWRRRLDALGPGMKIGLSWRGGVQKTGRVWRSLELAELLPLLRRAGVRFVNLQYGESASELAGLRTEHGIEVAHYPEAIADYDETAALVGALDLTLSVCTSIVHLAGALGRPVWVMTPLKPEARYGFSGETMHWYPSARLFRQPAYGDWDSVVKAVGQALEGAVRREPG
jgi:tetratricopeptide (TPR) repeat protein